MRPKKCTVCHALHAGGIIGAHSSKNDARANNTVNGADYRSITNKNLFPNLNGIHQVVFCFRQDGDRPHAATTLID